MKIGVISDTHLTKPTDELYQLQSGVFADVSMVIHAGDLTELDILSAFSSKEVVAVTGNMDSHVVRNQLPSQRVVEVSGFRIGLTHRLALTTGTSKILDMFGRVDAVIYGHTHRADNHVTDGVLFFNPGAFSCGFPFRGSCSVGILMLGEEISGKIIAL